MEILTLGRSRTPKYRRLINKHAEDSRHRFLFLDSFLFQFIERAKTAGGKAGFHAEVVDFTTSADGRVSRGGCGR